MENLYSYEQAKNENRNKTKKTQTGDIIMIKIIDTEIQDLNEGTANINNVQVRVVANVNERKFDLCFQTSNSFDVGATSKELSLNLESGDDFPALEETCLVNNLDVSDVQNKILIKSNAQTLFDDYIKYNYDLDDRTYNGLDANSITGNMTRKDYI